jgi:small subunit ribosomal protein S21
VIAGENESGSRKDNQGQDTHSGTSNRSGFHGSQNDRGQGDRGQYDRAERPKAAAMEVFVDHNIEKAMKILKRKLIKEGLFKELKSRRYYEKPSERKKRKLKESIKKVRKDEARQKKNSMLF